jgi:pimeloyl-ACP methyl ester carboxylesterase
VKRRILVAAGALVALMIIAGTVYEAIARRRALSVAPFTGTIVRVSDGHRIHMDCRGTGSPTIVLESGLDGLGSLSWTTVHDSLAATTRTCAYSRAGMLWSDAASGRFTTARATRDLHDALIAGGERAPWILVGHSLGGPYALSFTAAYPTEVAGIAFIDASHPRQIARLTADRAYPSKPVLAALWVVMRVGPALANAGALRLMSAAGMHGWESLMQVPHGDLAPSTLSGMMREGRQAAHTLSATQRDTSLGDRPILVLSAAKVQRGAAPGFEARRLQSWGALQADMARWSTRSRHIVVRDAGHYIHADRPDLVSAELRALVSRVRDDSGRGGVLRSHVDAQHRGGKAEHPLRGAAQVRGVRKTSLVRGGGDGLALHHDLPRAEEAAPEHVRAERGAGLLDEEVTEAARGEERFLRDLVEGERLVEMGADVFDRPEDAVIRYGSRRDARGQRLDGVLRGCDDCLRPLARAPRLEERQMASLERRVRNPEDAFVAAPLGERPSLRSLRLDEQDGAVVDGGGVHRVRIPRGDDDRFVLRPRFLLAGAEADAAPRTEGDLDGVVRVHRDWRERLADEDAAPLPGHEVADGDDVTHRMILGTREILARTGDVREQEI